MNGEALAPERLFAYIVGSGDRTVTHVLCESVLCLWLAPGRGADPCPSCLSLSEVELHLLHFTKDQHGQTGTDRAREHKDLSQRIFSGRGNAQVANACKRAAAHTIHVQSKNPTWVVGVGPSLGGGCWPPDGAAGLVLVRIFFYIATVPLLT